MSIIDRLALNLVKEVSAGEHLILEVPNEGPNCKWQLKAENNLRYNEKVVEARVAHDQHHYEGRNDGKISRDQSPLPRLQTKGVAKKA